MTTTIVTDSTDLANHAARTWRREFRTINSTFSALPAIMQTPEMAVTPVRMRVDSGLIATRAVTVVSAPTATVSGVTLVTTAEGCADAVVVKHKLRTVRIPRRISLVRNLCTPMT
jgi:hypothetical protein